MADSEEGAEKPGPLQMQIVGGPPAAGGDKKPPEGTQRGSRSTAMQSEQELVLRPGHGIDIELYGEAINPDPKVSFLDMFKKRDFKGWFPSFIGLREPIGTSMVRQPDGSAKKMIAIPLGAERAVEALERYLTRMNTEYAREGDRRGDAIGAAQSGVGRSRDELSSMFANLVETGQMADSKRKELLEEYDTLVKNVDKQLGGDLQDEAAKKATGLGVVLGLALGWPVLGLGLHIAAFIGVPLLGAVMATVVAPIGLPILGAIIGGFFLRKKARSDAAGEEGRRAQQFHAAFPDLIGSTKQVDRLPQTHKQILDTTIAHADARGSLDDVRRAQLDAASLDVRHATTASNPQVHQNQAYKPPESGKSTGPAAVAAPVAPAVPAPALPPH